MEDHKKEESNAPVKSTDTGIDAWNDRLDENLEQEETGNSEAGEKARNYSEEHGSGDQSDDTDPEQRDEVE